MPRDRGFRDPNLISLTSDFIKYWSRLTYHKNANAYISRLPRRKREQLLERVQAAEARYSSSGRGINRTLLKSKPLNGFVFAIKDNITTYDLPTTCASSILGGFRHPYDATVVKLLRAEGTVLLTKANMDEFGMGSHSTHSAFGPVKNGHRFAALSVGGSSGGSAYAVASEQCHIALGTDTGGSVRLPAAYMGLVGFKPSYGLLSRHGVVPYANSLDTVGIIAKNCLDILLTFQILNQPDQKDPTSLQLNTRRRIQTARHLRRPHAEQAARFRVVPITGHTPYIGRNDFPIRRKPFYESTADGKSNRRIGFPTEYNVAELHPLVRGAWIRTLTMLEQAGHEIVPISLPSTKAALSAYYVLAPAEASSNLAKYDGVRYGASSQNTPGEEGKLYAAYRGAHFGDEVKRRILLGAYSLSADAIDNYFIQAQKVRRLVQRDFDLIFKMKNPLHDNVEPSNQGVDFIVCPTAPTPPPRLSRIEKQAPVDAYINDVFTVPASLAGLPAISVPAPLDLASDNHPARMVGMQIIGQYGDDFGVIQFAKNEFEARGNWEDLKRLSEPPRIK